MYVKFLFIFYFMWDISKYVIIIYICIDLEPSNEFKPMELTQFNSLLE